MSRPMQKACHACRRLDHLENIAECSQCDLIFCHRCLSVRHGEDVFEILEIQSKRDLKWLCPKCRRGCGAGCEKTCCTCSYCCKLKGIEPRGPSDGRRFTKTAISAGFCVHDYLIHVETHESKQEIMKRKSQWEWAKVMSSKRTSTQASDCHDEGTRSLSDIGHNDVASGGEEMDHQETVGSEDDLLAAVANLPQDIYLLSLWFGREKEVSGNKISITLTDKEVRRKNRIKACDSPAKGVARIFKPTTFKNRPQSEKEWMLKGLKGTLKSHVRECNDRVERFCKEIESTIPRNM